jgi:type IV pilus assembly protein PilY1
MRAALGAVLLFGAGAALVARAAAPQLVVPDLPLTRSSTCAAPAAGARLLGGVLVAPGAVRAALVFKTSFDAGDWSGRLERLALVSGADGTAEVGGMARWEAGALLDGDPNATPARAAQPLPSERKIFTMLRPAGGPDATLPFAWNNLPSESRAQLAQAAPGAAPDALGEARVAFLRGERTREIGQRDGVFRRRASVLGDAINSVPLLVAPPSAAIDGPGYASFHARYQSRPGAVYLGANDGMLHAFDAASGAELFAYVPHALVPALAALADPAYRHRPYLDGSAGYGEALLNGRWRSVLVSGMGMGARGVFALDVSDPAGFDAGMGALWEFTDKDDPAIGFVRSAPLVAKLTIGGAAGVPLYRYFALVASGINNYGQDAAHGGSGGALFLLALDKPAAAAWRRGVNYYRLELPSSDAALANAVAAPALALGADGSARFAYAGDLQGNLWRVDFSGRPPWSAQTVFSARDERGQVQPISAAPRVVFAPGGGYLVLFGTGRLIEAADRDPASFTPQSFYAIRDRASGAPVMVRGRSELEPRVLSANGASYAVTGAQFDYNGAAERKGWYFDFPESITGGERAAGSAALASGAVFIDTLAPGADACAAPRARSYVLDALTGFAIRADGSVAGAARTGQAVQGLAPAVFEMHARVGARSPTGNTKVARSMGVQRWRSDASAAPVQAVTLTLRAGRFSWREIANWQELHDASHR